MSLYQRLIHESLAGNAVHKAVKARKGMVPNVTFVQPEGKFVNVATKVFCQYNSQKQGPQGRPRGPKSREETLTHGYKEDYESQTSALIQR